MRWRSRSPAETRAAAAALARAVGPAGGVIVLEGPLGAGKTVFAKGLAEGLGLDPDGVASPTFVIASEYPAPDGRRLVHVDAYRVESEAELEAAGLLDWLVPRTLVAVEWGDRVRSALPADRLELRLEPGDAATRTLHLDATGPDSRAVLERFASARRAVEAGARDTPPARH